MRTQTVQAIQTRYDGRHFRSRLEARWAVYFNAIGLKYDYEPEAYRFDDGTCYLPDFWFPQIGLFAEIKPTQFTDVEIAKCLMLPHGCLLIAGAPDVALVLFPNTDDIKRAYPDVEAARHYLTYDGSGYTDVSWVNLEWSAGKKRPWLANGEAIQDYITSKHIAAVGAALGARFT